MYRIRIPEGPSPKHCSPRSAFHPRRQRANQRLNGLSPGMTTARWHLSLLCFVHQTPLLAVAELPSPGAADLCHAARKHCLNIRFDVQLCPQRNPRICPTGYSRMAITDNGQSLQLPSDCFYKLTGEKKTCKVSPAICLHNFTESSN